MSQRGDWSSFRNAFLNDMSLSLTKEMFTPMPKKGKVRLAYLLVHLLARYDVDVVVLISREPIGPLRIASQ